MASDDDIKWPPIQLVVFGQGVLAHRRVCPGNERRPRTYVTERQLEAWGQHATWLAGGKKNGEQRAFAEAIGMTSPQMSDGANKCESMLDLLFLTWWHVPPTSLHHDALCAGLELLDHADGRGGSLQLGVGEADLLIRSAGSLREDRRAIARAVQINLRRDLPQRGPVFLRTEFSYIRPRVLCPHAEGDRSCSCQGSLLRGSEKFTRLLEKKLDNLPSGCTCDD